ncbi:hypothetical protein IRJ41_004094 [Triplophysa rosa]|uniref:Uncharacterized protein n=1 Tax=Triplophysa rosa TaxID=992332 RepID=A0A9W7TGW2_TRIRA|nr:hypothetical protein IRJ41_004094 [Triplophysa rosa]
MGLGTDGGVKRSGKTILFRNINILHDYKTVRVEYTITNTIGVVADQDSDSSILDQFSHLYHEIHIRSILFRFTASFQETKHPNKQAVV